MAYGLDQQGPKRNICLHKDHILHMNWLDLPMEFKTRFVDFAMI